MKHAIQFDIKGINYDFLSTVTCNNYEMNDYNRPKQLKIKIKKNIYYQIINKEIFMNFFLPTQSSFLLSV